MRIPESQVESLFCEAMEKETLSERTAFLETACEGNRGLRDRVQRLLTAHSRAGDFLVRPIISLESDENATHPPELLTDSAPLPADAAEFATTRFSFLKRSKNPRFVGRLGSYDVIELIGQGGMGIVFRAFDAGLERDVAVKVLSPDLNLNADARQRFLREARAVAALRHEHIVAIHLVDEIDGRPYFVMEYVPGESLQQRLNRAGAPAFSEVVQTGRQTIAAIQAAHNRGLIHRDIKPGNILLEQQTARVVITDFGLARPVDDSGISQPGIIAGTPQYMAPEQARGESVTPQSDLFSFGSVLYAMCAGRPPFRGDSTLSQLRAVCDSTPEPLREQRSDLPEWFESLVEQLLQKDPAQRPKSAAEVARLFEQQLSPLAAGAFPAGDLPSAGATSVTSTLSGARVIGGGLVVLAAATTAAVIWSQNPGKPVEAPSNGSNSGLIGSSEITTQSDGGRDDAAGLSPIKAREGLFALQASPDGSIIYAGGLDGGVFAWEVATGRTVHRLHEHRSAITSLALSADGKRLASTSADRKIRVWDTISGERISGASTVVPIAWIEISPDGQRLTGAPLAAEQAGSSLPRTPLGDPRRRLWVLDAESGISMPPFRTEPPRKLWSLAMSNQGSLIAVAAISPPSIVLFDAVNGEILNEWFTNARVTSLCFSPDDRLLYYCFNRTEIQAREIETGRIVFRRRVEGAVGRIAVSSDGGWLAAGGPEDLRLLNARSPDDPVIELKGHTGPIQDVIFLPFSDTIATCSQDRTVRFWSIPTEF